MEKKGVCQNQVVPGTFSLPGQLEPTLECSHLHSTAGLPGELCPHLALAAPSLSNILPAAVLLTRLEELSIE